jgi:hypothetical protein
MSDFLSNLIARSFTDVPVIQPRLPSLFEAAADEFFDEPQPSTTTIATPEMITPMPAIGAHETIVHTDAPARAPKLSPMEKAITTKSVTKASDARAEESLPKPGAPAHEKAPVSAQAAHSGEQTAEVRKLEIETKGIIVPVDSLRDGKKDAGYKEPPSEAFHEPRPIQPRRRKDFSPVEQRSSKSVPIIRVTIGRVEVRAVHPSAAAPKPAKPAPPKLSLDEYLRGGKR